MITDTKRRWRVTAAAVRCQLNEEKIKQREKKIGRKKKNEVEISDQQRIVAVRMCGR